MEQTQIENAIAVFGARVEEDGSAGLVLERRLRHAVSLYLTERRPIVVSGGETVKGLPTEAEAAKNSLVELGVYGSDVIIDNFALNTFENLLAFRAFMYRRNILEFTLVTDTYHAPRVWLTSKLMSIRSKTSCVNVNKLRLSKRQFLAALMHELGGCLYYLYLFARMGCSKRTLRLKKNLTKSRRTSIFSIFAKLTGLGTQALKIDHKRRV